MSIIYLTSLHIAQKFGHLGMIPLAMTKNSEMITHPNCWLCYPHILMIIPVYGWLYH